MASNKLSPLDRTNSVDISSASTMVPVSGSSSSSRLGGKAPQSPSRDITDLSQEVEAGVEAPSDLEKEFQTQTAATYSEMYPRSKRPFRARRKAWLARGGKLRPFRLLKQDISNIKKRYISDWTTFNQLVFASAVYVFFTNILPGITFASDLYVLTGMTWGTIEVVFSTGLCGLIFSLWASSIPASSNS